MDSVREKLTVTLCRIRLWAMFSVTGTDRLEPVLVPPSVGKMLVWSLSLRRYCSCAVMLTLVPCCAPRPPRPPGPPRPPPPPGPPRPPRPPAAAGVKLWVTRRLTLSVAELVVVT